MKAPYFVPDCRFVRYGIRHHNVSTVSFTEIVLVDSGRVHTVSLGSGCVDWAAGIGC